MKKQTELTIGCRCFLVHRSYAYQNKWGGKIILAKVYTFQNRKGKVEPVFKELGNKQELSLENYIPFIDIEEAIKSIQSIV